MVNSIDNSSLVNNLVSCSTDALGGDACRKEVNSWLNKLKDKTLDLKTANGQAQEIFNKYSGVMSTVRYIPAEYKTQQLLKILFKKAIEYKPQGQARFIGDKSETVSNLKQELQELSDSYPLKVRVILLINDVVQSNIVQLVILYLIPFYFSMRFYTQTYKLYHWNVQFMQSKGVPFIVNNAPRIILQTGNKIATFCDWCYRKKIQIILIGFSLEHIKPVLNQIPYVGTGILRIHEFIIRQIFPTPVFLFIFRETLQIPSFLHGKAQFVSQYFQRLNERVTAKNRSRAQAVAEHIFLKQLTPHRMP